MRKLLAGWWWEGLCLLVYLLLAGTQLFIRPIIGVAPNGDFPKVLWPHHICDPDHERDAYSYVTIRYVIDPTCSWNSELHSSESLVVILNKWLAEVADRTSFSITGAGKMHLAVMLCALAFLLWGLHGSPPVIRFGLPPLAILVFSDVAYVGYLNSFYMDAASLVFLAATLAAAVAAVLRPTRWMVSAYAVAGALFAYSKTQHLLTAFLLAGFALWMAVRTFRAANPSRPLAAWWTFAALTVAASASALLALTPSGYKAEPFYSVIFLHILPGVPDAGEALAELALPASYAELSGTHAYSERSPIPNTHWRADFSSRLSYGRMVAFYLRNPDVLFRLLDRGLRDDGSGIRPTNLGNYPPGAGFPPLALSRSFALWSDWRAWLLRVLPYHVVVLYGLTFLGGLHCLFHRAWAGLCPLYPLALLLSIGGVLEFSGATLLDATETARHLFFFHVVTEGLLLLVASAGLSVAANGLAHRKRAPLEAVDVN